MGGGDDAPDAPDYGPITEIFKGLSEYAKANSTEMMAWAKNAYKENKKVSDKVINNAINWMQTQSGWAKQDRAYWESTYKPLEQALVKEAQEYASPERLAYESGKAQADVASQFEAARQTAAKRLEDFNVDPSQVRQGALDLGTRVAEGAAKASAGNQAQWHAEEVARQLREQAINIGRANKTDASQAAAASTAQGVAGANTGLAQTASGAQTMGTPLQWSGLQTDAAKGWGQMLSQGYQDQMAKWKAEQESSSGWGGLIGTVAGSFLGPMGSAVGGAAGNYLGKYLGVERGGMIPYLQEGGGVPGVIPDEMSPSGGAIPDDVSAVTDGGAPAQINAGEFILPKDVTSWMGEKSLQQMVMKARKEMSGQNGERPAQPETVPGGVPPGTPPEGVGAIPLPVG
jgi:hypothetical protein